MAVVRSRRLKTAGGVIGGTILAMVLGHREGVLAKGERKKGGPHVVVALDELQCKKVLEWCARYAFENAGKITFVHASECEASLTFSAEDEIDFAGGTISRKVNEEIKRSAYRRGQTFLMECSVIANDLGFEPDERKVVLASKHNTVKYALLDLLEREHPDIVVCGSKGMGIVGRAVIGSVADALVHNAHCTVAVVKDRTVTGAKGYMSKQAAVN